MSNILDFRNPWRDRMQPASFRGAVFHVDVGARSSGRRAVVHEYPKRDLPYAEDMGRMARRFSVRAYLVGPDYLDRRDALITALEADGPGRLRLPWAVRGQDMDVLAGAYSMNEERQRGGHCTFEMEFTEAGKPGFGVVSPSTAAQVGSSATGVQSRAAESEKETV